MRIQTRLTILFVITFGLLSLLGGLFFWQINTSVKKSKNLIEKSSRSFWEINELVKRSGDAQRIFDEILLFGSASEQEIFALQADFSAAALDFDVFLNALVLGSESDRFKRINNGVDYFVWKNFTLESSVHEDFAHDVDSLGDQTFNVGQYKAIEKKYNEFVYNVNEATAAQKRYLRLSRENEDVLDEDGASKEVGQREIESLLDQGTDIQTAQKSARVFGQRANQASEAIVAMLSIVSNDLRDALLDRIVNESRIQAQLYQQGGLVLVSGILLLIVVLSVLVHYLAVRPLQQLTDSANGIVQGKKDMVIPFQNRGDEIGLLAGTLSGMIEALKRDADTLEVQVHARTKQLDDKNVQLGEYIYKIDKTTKDLMRREVELTQANQRLKEANQAKSEFVSVAAHQLRTPLTAIRWIYELLHQAKDIPSEHQDIIENGKQATDNLITTVNDILNVARIDEGQMTFAMKKNDFVALLSGILTETEFDAKHEGITFESHIQKDTSFVFMFDWEKMDMVVRNLLSNAIKYTKNGGIVQLYVSRKDDEMVMVVIDNGIGIPMDQQPRIFTKFFRADNALLHKTNGSGLGLYVTHDIIEKHQGTITLESAEGEGAVFTVNIPMVR